MLSVSKDSSYHQYPSHQLVDRGRVRRSHSAGGVAYRLAPSRNGTEKGAVEVALIATNQGRRWQLPKGRLEPGEVPVDAAIREVKEETGLITVYEKFLKTVEYRYVDTYSKDLPELVIKQVDFFLLRVVGGTLTNRCIEVDDVGWHTPAEAITQLTFESEQECIELAQEHWR
jgi:8-oxo-dGTP pyrophosphatase MutT (NUDIX family)